MNRDRIIFIFVVAVIIVIILGTLSGGESRMEYIDRITKERAEKDLFFKRSEDSPIKKKEEFVQLNYFPPNPDYKIQARIISIPDPQAITLSTSDGLTKEYKEYGYAEFELEDKTHRLLLLHMEAYDDKLFVPFADNTSTEETYGAGRYLELEKPNGNILIIDFNLAFNPYCAYEDGFSCPFPPRENILDVAISAGEKKYYQN